MIATVTTLTEVPEKDRKVLGLLRQVVGRWEIEGKAGKGAWAFATQGVPGDHAAHKKPKVRHNEDHNKLATVPPLPFLHRPPCLPLFRRSSSQHLFPLSPL